MSAKLDIGGDDQPLFVFSVAVDLPDDLAAAEYPLDELEELASILREELGGSTVDDWSWLVSLRTKIRAGRRMIQPSSTT